jgi:hypothetical protein
VPVRGLNSYVTAVVVQQSKGNSFMLVSEFYYTWFHLSSINQHVLSDDAIPRAVPVLRAVMLSGSGVDRHESSRKMPITLGVLM